MVLLEVEKANRLRKIGPGETARKAAPKGTRKNSQAKGSGRDEAPESGGNALTPKVQPGGPWGRFGNLSGKERRRSGLLGVLCAFLFSHAGA